MEENNQLELLISEDLLNELDVLRKKIVALGLAINEYKFQCKKINSLLPK